MQVFVTMKMADHIKNRGTSVKGSKVLQSIRHNNNELYLKCMVIKYVKQTTVKQQESA
jgi:hypothetical protein